MDQIIGREAEVATLTKTVSRAVAGSPRFLVLEGPPGIGKSALLSAAAAAAEQAGARVLRARANAGESDLPLGVVGQLFELALDGGSEEERRAWLRGPAAEVPRILNLDARETPGLGGSLDRHAASRALYWLTANIARRAPLVVLVDDIQWADAGSLRWLIHLSRRMQRLPLAVVATLSPDVPAGTTGLVAQLLSGVDLMPLSGLDAGSVDRLIAERLGVPPAAGFAAQCLAATGGKPLLLQDLLRVLAAADTAPSADGTRTVPRCGSRQLGEAVVMRLSQSGNDAVRLATSIALLGQTELETAAAAAGLPLATAVTVAAALSRMDVLTLGEQVAFRHDLVRRAMLAALPEGERGQLQVRIARALFERCAPAPKVAAHLARTATPVGEDWAVRTLWSAAQIALGEGRPERALVALRRLLAEPHQPRTRVRYLAELGAVEVYEDLPAAVEHLRAALSRLDEPGQVAGVASRLAGALLDSAAPVEAAAVLSDAVGRVAPQDPDLADELDLQRLSMTTWSRASSPGLADHLAGLLGRMRRRRPPGRLEPLAEALRAFRLSLDAAGLQDACVLATSALDGIVTRDDLGEDQTIAGLGNGAAALLRAGEYRLVIDYCQRQAVHADRRGLRLLAAWARALQAAAHHAAGEHAQAAASARAALAAPVCARGGPRRLATVLATAVLADCHAEQGEYQAGLAVLAGAQLDGDVPDLWVYDQVLRSRGRLRLSAGDAPGALADLLEGGRRGEVGATGDQVAAWWRPAAAVAYAALGKRTEAVALAREQVALARAAKAPGALAEALAVHGVLARRRQPITEAVAILAAPGAAPAGDPVRQALDLLRGRGAELLASQLERLVEPAERPPNPDGPAGRCPAADQGHRPTFGPAALTAHERRLIAMAVAGQTNDAIAGRFGVSRRAVEFHFTHIYRKLGITRRPQLHRFATVVAA